MTVVRKFHPEVRLKKLLAEAGGVRVSQALERAAEQLEDVRESCMLAIDEKIGRIGELGRAGGEDNLDRCYYIANEIYAEAGVFAMKELSAAAHSLCTLLSAADLNTIPTAAIMVHVDTMRALRNPEIARNGVLRVKVLAELQGLTSKLAAAAQAG